MSDDILILLRLLDREEGLSHTLGKTVLILILILITSLQRGKLGVHTHQASHTANIFVNKASD